jgi:hypothetical protein
VIAHPDLPNLGYLALPEADFSHLLCPKKMKNQIILANIFTLYYQTVCVLNFKKSSCLDTLNIMNFVVFSKVPSFNIS